MQRFVIDKCGLVYQKVGKEKVVSQYGLSKMSLKDD